MTEIEARLTDIFDSFLHTIDSTVIVEDSDDEKEDTVIDNSEDVETYKRLLEIMRENKKIIEEKVWNETIPSMVKERAEYMDIHNKRIMFIKIRCYAILDQGFGVEARKLLEKDKLRESKFLLAYILIVFNVGMVLADCMNDDIPDYLAEDWVKQVYIV